MPRFLLTDEYWSKLRPIMLESGVYDKPSLRQTVEGILYRLRVGCPWRDLPDDFGPWNSVFKRFNDWSSKGKLLYVFESLAADPDKEWNFIDGSISKAHQHSSGAARGSESAIGKSVAGNKGLSLISWSPGFPVKKDVVYEERTCAYKAYRKSYRVRNFRPQGSWPWFSRKNIRTRPLCRIRTTRHLLLTMQSLH